MTIVMVSAALLASIGSPGAGGVSLAAGAGRPNIVLILTDDQRFDTLRFMTNVQSEIVRHGVEFENAYVVNSLCCPSRTTIQTGRYSHSTGVWTNAPPWGAFDAFRAHHDERSTIATWLQSAGYTTALVGKFLNHYREAALGGYEPPGWDRWVALAEENTAYYDYDLSIDGRIVHRGTAPSDYSTTVLAGKAESFIRSNTGPLFLYFAPAAPHAFGKGPPLPAPGDETAFPGLPDYRPRSYNERDVTDKPSWARVEPMSDDRQRYVDYLRRRQLQSQLAVDRAVGRIVRALSDTGRLGNTLLVFMSDNGYMLGEHRLNGKEYPYEESIRVPMVIRFDPVTSAARTDDHLVLNLDIASTFADAAGVSAPGVQGRSLLPLLRGSDIPWRHDFLVEHANDDDVKTLPPYLALHTRRAMYVLYGNGVQEYYDLVQDPFELVNRASNPALAKVLAGMRLRIGQLTGHRAPPGWGIATP